jgi:hypothetical protein
MAYLHDHTIIASFIEEKPSPNAFNAWLAFFNQKVGGKVLFDCSLGKSFFMLKSEKPITMKKLLMLTPFQDRLEIGYFFRKRLQISMSITQKV